jgi:signal transduction histidine kinase
VLAQIVRTGKPSARVQVRGDGDPLDELGRLANEMLDRIEALVAGMKGSLDDVAHDLRTPLQRLRATAETALREDQPPEAARAALVVCIDECDRVASMLTTLMDISEAETGSMTLRPERLDVGALLRETAELYEHVAEDNGVELVVNETAGLEVTGDRARLRQALANLVDNALKYTPRGGHVSLRGRGAEGRVLIECADDGPGIPAAEQPRIWERLYRGEKSRTSKGLGLGLSLVRSIARAHGGEATVESREGGGATFRLELPAPASITEMSSSGKTAVRRFSV